MIVPHAVFRRVCVLAIVTAVTAFVALNWGPLWNAVMLKKVIATLESPECIVLRWERRWGSMRGLRHGPQWLLNKETGELNHCVYENGDYAPNSVFTQWSADGGIWIQIRLNPSSDKTRPYEERRSPPWWPHPQRLDLSEF